MFILIDSLKRLGLLHSACSERLAAVAARCLLAYVVAVRASSPRMPIFYALVARKTTVLTEFTGRSGNFPTVTRMLLGKITDGDQKMSYVYDKCVAAQGRSPEVTTAVLLVLWIAHALFPPLQLRVSLHCRARYHVPVPCG